MERDRIFVPSTVFDNQELLNQDPGYLATLAALPEAERNALLYGSWDSFSGQVFTEWINDPMHYEDRKWTHVVKPFDIPSHWQVIRGFDFGFAKPFSVGWFAIEPGTNKLYMIKEYYGCNGEPNKGIAINPYEIAKNIKELEAHDPMLKGRQIFGIADPSIWDKSRGESVAQMMEKTPNFIYWRPGDNTRLPGKMQFHYRLAFDKFGDCMLQVFDTCKHFIRTFPMLVYSERHPEDIDTDMEDQAYDMCRYVLMDNPIAPRENILQKIDYDDPLNQREQLYNRSHKTNYINI